MAALLSLSLSFLHRLGGYVQLTKPRLSVVVVFSAVMGAMIAGLADWGSFVWVMLGGYAVTGSANAINQVLEREVDALMERTKRRPLVVGLLLPGEGVAFSVLLLGVGVWLLWRLNWQAAALAAFAWVVYGFIYTPLKRVGPIAVPVGAIPGALPPVIGYWAVQPELNPTVMALFGLQFVWQFAHFWVLAWLLAEDYARGGFRLLPFPRTHSRANRFAILISVLALPVVSLAIWPWVPWNLGLVASLLGLGLALVAVYLLERPSVRSMRRLFLGLTLYLTFLYLGVWLFP